MSRASSNPAIRFLPVEGANHFSILFPITHLLADKILHDEGASTNISFTADELRRAPGG